MSILHADNFSFYGTNRDLLNQGVYAEQNCTLVDDPDGLSGGTVLLTFPAVAFNSTTAIRYVMQNGADTVAGIAFRGWLDVLPSTNDFPTQVQVRSAANIVLGYLSFSSSGQVRFTVVGGANYTTPAPVITANGWYHYEIKYVCNGDATIDFEVRIEGVTVLFFENVPGSATEPGQLAFFRDNVSNNHRLYVKDLVFWDGNGTQNNDFLGSVIVGTLLPNSDVDMDWTPVGGLTGYGILDNSPPVDTQYIAAGFSPIPDPYLAGLSNLPSDTTSVKALISFVRAAKSDGGDGTFQVGLLSHPDTDPTVTNGADRPITAAFTYWRDVFELDPVTSAPWLPGDVNNVQLRLNRTT